MVDIQEQSCELLGNMASHKSIASAILRWKPCVQLVALLRRASIIIIVKIVFIVDQGGGCWGRSPGCICPNADESIVGRSTGNSRRECSELPLGTVPVTERRCPCLVLQTNGYAGIPRGHRIDHSRPSLVWAACSSVEAGPVIFPGSRSSSSISDTDVAVNEQARFGLDQITQWPCGAQAFGATGLNNLLQLYGSPNMEVRRWLYGIMKRRASRKARFPDPSTSALDPSAGAHAARGFTPLVKLVSLLR